MKELKENLKKCFHIFDISKDSTVRELMLKLMMHEFFGWIEISFDEIYLSIGRKNLNEEIVRREIVEPCYSFDYKNLMTCLSSCIGINNRIELENTWNEKDKKQFLSTLNNMYKKRCQISHTYYHSGIPYSYMGYYEILNNLKIIDNGIKKIKKLLQKSNLM